MEPCASIIIPAHNEEHRIRGLLQSLSEGLAEEQYSIFVICNGCTDRTREVAEEFEGIRVVEIEDAGKHFALNEGDRLADDIFPRLYCDADLRVDFSSIKRLIDRLTTEGLIVAGPTVRYGVEHCSWGIKKYYQALETPIMTQWLDLHLMGRGLYGASRTARKRFGEFPPLFADDKFFDSQYAEAEKVIVANAEVTIWTPRTIRELIRNETRVAKGNRELAAYAKYEKSAGNRDETAESMPSTPSEKFKTLLKWAKDLRLSDCLPLAIYLCVTGMTRPCLAILKIRQRQVSWR
jgi:glycosyltransferase involved in cell wall biosynthesis